jgi:[ribosomal protein S5]-alanine N-acetyltransferase
LLALDRHSWQRVAEDPIAFAADHSVTFGADPEVVRAVGAQTVALLVRTGAQPPWSGYLAVDWKRGAVVGTCGFIAPPDSVGRVEIAYFTFPAYERQGCATAMARGLVDRASMAPDVRLICAHTLPERNASARILEKLGFAQKGEEMDPDAGPVWRWERDARPGSPLPTRSA